MIQEFPELKTPRCRISGLRPKDADDLQAATDASVTSFIHFLPQPFTMDDAMALIASQSEGHRFLGIWDRDRRQLLGVVGLHPKGRDNVEIGYWLTSAVRGQGLATEAVAAVVETLASRQPHLRIVAECHPGNLRSWALLNRINFRPSGERGERPGRWLFCWQHQPSYRIDVC